MILLAQEIDILAHAQCPRQMLGGPTLRPVAHHQQAHIRVFAHLRKNADAIEHALHRAEVGKVNQQLLPIGRELGVPHAVRSGR